jgi:hypothetical protein
MIISGGVSVWKRVLGDRVGMVCKAYGRQDPEGIRKN